MPGEAAGPAGLWAEPQVPPAPRCQCTAVPQPLAPVQGGHEGWLSTQLATSSSKAFLWVGVFTLWGCAGPRDRRSARGRPKQALGTAGGSQLVGRQSPKQSDSTPGQTQLGHGDRPPRRPRSPLSQRSLVAFGGSEKTTSVSLLQPQGEFYSRFRRVL